MIHLTSRLSDLTWIKRVDKQIKSRLSGSGFKVQG